MVRLGTAWENYFIELQFQLPEKSPVFTGLLFRPFHCSEVLWTALGCQVACTAAFRPASLEGPRFNARLPEIFPAGRTEIIENPLICDTHMPCCLSSFFLLIFWVYFYNDYIDGFCNLLAKRTECCCLCKLYFWDAYSFIERLKVALESNNIPKWAFSLVHFVPRVKFKLHGYWNRWSSQCVSFGILIKMNQELNFCL